jgi:hypothetical protein
VANSAWRSEPPSESGGGGLVSTIDDYFAFSRMMLNKGRHGRQQILSRATVELILPINSLPSNAGLKNLLRYAFQLGPRNGGGHPAQRDLPHPGPARLDRRLRHNGIHRSCKGHDRHPLHAAPDGFSGTAEGIHRLLDTDVWSNGIGDGQRRRGCCGRRYGTRARAKKGHRTGECAVAADWHLAHHCWDVSRSKDSSFTPWKWSRDENH